MLYASRISCVRFVVAPPLAVLYIDTGKSCLCTVDGLYCCFVQEIHTLVLIGSDELTCAFVWVCNEWALIMEVV